MKVSVATKNPGKTNAVKRALAEAFADEMIDVEQVDVTLDLPEQPFGEALADGATKRAQAALGASDCDLGIGIEAGLMRMPGTGQWMSVQVCVLTHRDGRQSMGMGPGYELPSEILAAVLAGEPLREAFERLLDVDDPERNGAIYYLSGGLLDRTELTTQAVRMALIAWSNERARQSRGINSIQDGHASHG